MTILSMTATFGKLEHQTLELKPGLNVIEAPNEWGKSTWCAFLLNMLYGIDTKERTKQDSLADKDRYAPWSGKAMSGRIELNWNGRDITIERTSNTRIPLGVFRAYETETGMDIPELTASNCGQMLLGVERNVFTRAGFLRLADMPVTQDDALRRRLNNLVTTGDENSDADKLGQTLRDLKNKCRSNKANGLIPEAEAQRDRLRNQLWDLQELEQKSKENKARQQLLESNLTLLENHKTALEYENSKENARRVKEANLARDEAAQTLKALQSQCGDLPDKQVAMDRVRQLEQLKLQKSVLDAEVLPPVPDAPQAPAPFAGLTAEEAVQQAGKDKTAYDLHSKPVFPVFTLLAVLCILGAAALAFFADWLYALPLPVIAIVFLILHFRKIAAQKSKRLAIAKRYDSLSPEQWCAVASQYQQACELYDAQTAGNRAVADNLNERKTTWQQAAEQAADGKTLDDAITHWTQIIAQADALQEAQRNYRQAENHAEALAAVAKTVEAPKLPDTLTLTFPETEQAINEAQFELKQLQLQLGQYIGQMESLGQPFVIQAKLDAVNHRIGRLETYYNALELAQNALFKTTVALQRRFSPRITKRAQALFSKLTGNRYQRITMSEDLSLQAAAEGEDTLRELRRRSDGTVDQLYLALRLAVAEELTPQAPLILDDALVRFDDARLALTMDILKETAQSKQIILFTCQEREKKYL